MPKPIDRQLLESAKVAYSCRRVDLADCAALVRKADVLRSGDLLLARIRKLGHHHRLELASGRRAHLFVGDTVLVALGNRYAPDYFEAVVPDNLNECWLVAGGGIASRFLVKHERARLPTRLESIGLLTNDKGAVMNLADYALTTLPVPTQGKRPLTFAVMGTAMNSGKTTLAASLVKGLVAAGLKTGAAKILGTGAGPDTWFLKDSGAEPALDIVDAGLSSTYLETPDRIQQAIELLEAQLIYSGVEAMVLEIGDGLFQKETRFLLEPGPDNSNYHEFLTERVDGVFFAAGDALGVRAGAELLNHAGVPLLAVGGLICRSPLAVREAEDNVGVPVLHSDDLQHSEILGIVQHLMAAKRCRRSAILQVV